MDGIYNVKAFITNCELGEIHRVAEYLSDDFSYIGHLNHPIGKSEFTEFIKILLRAFSNFSYNVHNLQDNGSIISGAIQITGVQTGILNLPGIQPIPSTGIRVSLPPEPVEFFFDKDGYINRIVIERVSGGGINGILEQLGFQPSLLLNSAR